MTTHPGVWLMRALAPLPLPWLRALGDVLGRLLFALARRRRHIALVNLRLAFPAWSEAERMDVARRSFIAFAQSFIDRAWVWHAPDAVVRQRIRLTGAVDELRRPEAAVLFAPHFYGMDAGGLALPLRSSRAFTSIFATHPDPAVDAWFMAGRQRFGDVRMLNRSDGVKPIIASLRKGGLLYLLPDMDYGRNDSVFVPFYGVTAATIPSLSRFARLGRAKVVGVYSRMTPTGYVAEVSPAWANYPTDDAEADTARMNRELQAVIDTMPEQYYWVHKRFKTRPEGEPSVYG